MSADWVHSLADVADDPRCGGKARGLAKLRAAGLPVPPGVVIDSRAFEAFAGSVPRDAAIGTPDHVLREAGPADEHALAHRVAALAEAHLPATLLDEVRRQIGDDSLLAVRSSATIEDAAAGAGAGLFSSETSVQAIHLGAAIKAVWQSALSAAVAAYARRREASVEIAVIVQPFIAGERITIYTRPPGNPTADEVLVQRGDSLQRLPRMSAQWLVALALRAESAIGANGGADVELIEPPGGGQLTIVQARPIVHPAKARRMPMPAPLLAALVADGRTWTWDVTHNPDPLSTAQAELVERVDRAGVAPYSLRTVSGYLYTARRDDVSPIVHDGDAAAIIADIEARLAPMLLEPTSLEAAVRSYVDFNKIWSMELSPLVASLRRVATTHDKRPSSVEAILLDAARGRISEDNAVGRLAVLAPAWDVAVPTYIERPEVLRDAIARARGVLAGTDAVVQAAETSSGSRGADLAERDDVWFAHAQWHVRRALIARGRELGLDTGDEFWLSFDELMAGIDPETARRKASGARAAATRAAQWDPPLVVNGDAAETVEARELHGVAGGVGKASGRVVRYASLASAVMARAGDVIVARAITPALAVMMIGCAAIVSETGGLLDHGAAMARELGIPCVVGCKDAWRLLDDGALVEVDGDAGIVSLR